MEVDLTSRATAIQPGGDSLALAGRDFALAQGQPEIDIRGIEVVNFDRAGFLQFLAQRFGHILKIVRVAAEHNALAGGGLESVNDSRGHVIVVESTGGCFVQKEIMRRTRDLGDGPLALRHRLIGRLHEYRDGHVSRVVGQSDDADVIGCAADRPGLMGDFRAFRQNAFEPRLSSLATAHDVEQQVGGFRLHHFAVMEPNAPEQGRHTIRRGRVAGILIERGGGFFRFVSRHRGQQLGPHLGRPLVLRREIPHAVPVGNQPRRGPVHVDAGDTK